MILKFFKWLVYNFAITGVLVSGYVSGNAVMADKIIFGWYVFVVSIMTICMLMLGNKEYAEKLKEQMTFYFWNCFEFVWIIIAFYLNYSRIGILMIVELFIVLYIAITLKIKEREDS